MKRIIIKIAEEGTDQNNESTFSNNSYKLLRKHIQDYTNQRMDYIIKEQLHPYIDNAVDEFFKGFFDNSDDYMKFKQFGTDNKIDEFSRDDTADGDMVFSFKEYGSDRDSNGREYTKSNKNNIPDNSSDKSKYSTRDIINKYKSSNKSSEFRNIVEKRYDYIEKIMKGVEDDTMEKMKYGKEKKQPDIPEGECMCSLCNPAGYFGLFFDDEEDEKEPYEDIMYDGALYIVVFKDPANESDLPTTVIVKYFKEKFYYAYSTEDPDIRCWKEFPYIDIVKMLIPVPSEIL